MFEEGIGEIFLGMLLVTEWALSKKAKFKKRVEENF